MKSPDSRLLAVGACLLWSTAFIGVKSGLTVMPPFLFAGLRFTAAGIAVAFLSFQGPLRYFRQLKGHWRLILLTALFQTFLLYSCFYSSLDRLNASTAAIVNGMGPLVTAVFAHFLLPDSPLDRRRFFCLLLGVTGVSLVVFQGMEGLGSMGHISIGGVLFMLGALVSGALGSVIVSRSSDKLDALVLNSAQLILGGLLLLVFSLVRGDRPYGTVPWIFWPALLWLIGVTGGGFSIWFYLLKVRKEPLTNITMWKFLIPLSGSVLSWVFMKKDEPGIFSVSGMLLTAFSIWLFYQKPKKQSELGERR